jgi:hypothetical protein
MFWRNQSPRLALQCSARPRLTRRDKCAKPRLDPERQRLLSQYEDAGSGTTFEDFFEFTLPTAEYITASMSISGPSMDQIPAGKGTLILSTWTSTSGVSPFIPLGAVIEQAMVSAPSSGGQTAVVGTFTPFGDYELAGTYFVEVSGTSGIGALKLAVDGNVTTLAAVPEPSTWAMFGIGFAGLAGMGLTRRRGNRESARYAL